MSNDTNYNLKIRLKNKAMLFDVRNFVALIKPELSKFYNGMNLNPKLSSQQMLSLLGIQKFSEIITWIGPYCDSMGGSTVGPVKKVGDVYEFEIQVWSNEGGGNVWVSGPDGELAHLLDRFPDLQIEGTFVDEYGAGSVRGYEKIHEMDRVQYLIQDESYWEDEDQGYSVATKELIISAYCGELDLPRLRRLIKDGADVNVSLNESSLMEMLLPPNCELDDRKVFAKALALILESGWRYESLSPSMNEKLKALADELKNVQSARPVCRKMATALLGRLLWKNECASQLFQESLRARDVSGILASTFLGVDFDVELTKAPKPAQAWLKRQGMWV